MPKLFQIALELNKGSVGRIAEQIGEIVMENGWSSYIAYARDSNPSKSITIKIGTNIDTYLHGLETRIFDNHCFSSKSATVELVNVIKGINPDIIHLHHLHGYYINIEILFKFLRESKLPVVWTFHDCWSFTGHCAYFDFVGCEKWKVQCYDCEQKFEYPKSLLFDRSRRNYVDKKRIFNSIDELTIVPVSYWLSDKVKESFLAEHQIVVIQNGVDVNLFSPKDSRAKIDENYGLNGKFLILGVASKWEKRKGLNEFIELASLVDDEQFAILLVGLTEPQIKKLPKSVIGIPRTENVNQLAEFYSAADVFLNPTFEDTFPTTNLESLACGTPIITYMTGGSVESVGPNTGVLVEKGDVKGLRDAVLAIKTKGKEFYKDNCRFSAIKNFDKRIKFSEYLDLYENLLRK
jgi:putative colanic acid biosynthesis glycosyltransferase